MSFWKRVRSLWAPVASPEERVEPAAPSSGDLPGPVAVLAALGQPDGPDEQTALRALEQAVGTLHEHAALNAVASALLRTPVPPSIRLRCAHVAADRGELNLALRLAEGLSSPHALMLQADLAHQLGQLPMALTLVERVLASQVDYPGARERHQRWRAELAPSSTAPSCSHDETLVVPTTHATPFRVAREVARGGAGAIYEAYDRNLGRRVALKIYHRSHARLDRVQLEREARTAVSLRGPGVVRLFDVDFDEGWIAYEWVEHGSLRQLIASARVDVLVPLTRWALPLAQALARVHRAGLVHADVKPGNVLFRRADQPVLGDFGIALAAGMPSVGGSAGYLSPERLQGRPLQPDDDVFGFGKVLLEVCERVPTDAESEAMSRIAAVCMQPEGSRPADGTALLSLLGRESA